jgi:electron transfer flavoprotein alpha subunit
MEKKSIRLNTTQCTNCSEFIKQCPVGAIEYEKDDPHDKLSEYKDVWVYIEHAEGYIESVSYELIGKGRKLADELGVKLCAVFIGSAIHDKVQLLIAHGADIVYLVEKTELLYFRDEPYSQVFIDLIKKYKPSIILCGATAIGRSLIARVAATVKCGLTADCTKLEIDPKTENLLQTRPAFGGKVMATIISPDTRPQMATVRPNIMKKEKIRPERLGKVFFEEIEIKNLVSRTKRLDFIEEKESTVNLAEANIIVAGGRGMREAENFTMLKNLAKVLGAGLAASRSVVDAGWISYSHQVGQTGKTVCPKLYIACGISGQIQHIAGMANSDIIIAINTDKDAPIFHTATYGIVADALEIVPLLTQEFKKRLCQKD